MEPQDTVTAPALLTSRIKAMDEAEFVLSFVEKSDQKRRLRVPVWDEVLANYMVSPYSLDTLWVQTRNSGARYPSSSFLTGRRSQGSHLKDPETHQIVETITSQAIALLLGGRDYLTAIPIGSDDYDKARLLSRLLMSILEQPGVWRTNYQIIKDAFLFGTAIVEIGWEDRSRTQFVPQGIDLYPAEVLFRSRPTIRAVDRYDFYEDPSGTRIQEDMIGCVKRFRVTRQEAMRLAGSGKYDPQDVKLAIAMSQKDSKEGKRAAGKTLSDADRRFCDEPRDLPEAFAPLDGFEYWGESPVDAGDNMSNRVITLLNGVRVRSRGNPFLDGNIPMKEVVVNPVGGRFDGLAPAEVIRFLQDSIDNMLMVLNDAADLAVRGPIMVGQSWGGNVQQLRERKLMDVIEISGTVKEVAPVPVDLSALAFAAQELARRKLNAREGSGANNPMQAIAGPTEKTATETSELVRLASQRIEPMVQLIERDDYPWIGRTIHSRLRQFAPTEGAIATLAGETFEVPFEAIDIDADIRFTGTRQSGSRFQRAVQYREAVNILGSEQGRNMVMRFPEVVIRYLRDGLDIVDAEEIVQQARNTLAQEMQAAAAANFAENLTGAGAGPTRGGGGTPSAPSPGQPETFGSEAGQTEVQGQRVA